MASITVRDIPDDIYEGVKKLAARTRRSLNAEVIVALEMLVAEESLQQQRSQALQRIIARRKTIAPSSVESIALLREDRAR